MDDLTAVIDQLTEGLRALPMDAVARVRHFLTEYLGDARHPVPFGGRSDDFARLDGWLMEEQAAPYALLAAPAGRGKSALLLRWCQRWLGRPELAVVYFPVSIRFRTNLAGVVFPALVALLAQMHGEAVPADPNMHAEIWRSLLREYLARPLPAGRKLVLVLDGIDEAADWTPGPALFPEEPPSGLHVLLSARYLANDRDATSWLQRLGWVQADLARTFELYPLDRAGIASVLVQMGFPLDLLGMRIDIVSELHRLSEGDPLVIRLYVDDLWKRGEAAVRLKPGDLAAIQPGLVGYFERWWNDQRMLWREARPEREAVLQSVLNLLAGALGPLSQADILELLPDESALRPVTLAQHLEPLARFVIGDGLHQGYVFSHPRLANYFLEERLDEDQRREVEKRFLMWGKSTLEALNQGRLQPTQASPYIVQYFGAHLERVQADPRDLLALVSNGWRQAWEKLDRANAGFLGDSERAWSAARREDSAAISAGQLAVYLGAEVRSLLCRVSVNSMTSNISSRLMLEAVKTGVWTPAQGLACIRLIADLALRARELVGLAHYVQEPLRGDILQEALDTATAIKDEFTRFNLLVELAPGLSENLLGQILAIVPAIEDEADRAGLLAELAPALRSYPLLSERALDMAATIEEEEYLALALAGLAMSFHTEQLDRVLQLIRTMQDERYCLQTLLALLPRLPVSYLQDAMHDPLLLPYGLARLRFLVESLASLPEAAQKETSEEIQEQLREIGDAEYRIEILLKLVAYTPEHVIDQVLKEIDSIWDEHYRIHALRELLPYVADEQISTFLHIVQALRNEEYRSALFQQLLPRLSSRLLAGLLENILTIWDEGRRVELLARVAPFVSPEFLPRFLELSATIQDLGYRIWLQAELAIALPKDLPVLPFDIVKTFRSMLNEEERLQTLLAIVPRLSDEASGNVFDLLLPGVFTFNWSLKSEDQRASILAKLCSYLPQRWLVQVLPMVRALTNEIYQTRVLVELAPCLGEQALYEILALVRGMRGREQRAQVLEVLVASLPTVNRATQVREMVQVLQIIEDEGDRVHLSTAFAACLTETLPEELIMRVLEELMGMDTDLHRTSVIQALAPYLSENTFNAVLALVVTLDHGDMRVHALEALAPYVPQQSVSAFLAAVQTLQRVRGQAQVLVPLVRHASQRTFASALALAWQAEDEYTRSLLIGTLAPYVTEPFLGEFWDGVLHIHNEGRRAWILSMLALRMSDESFPQLWSALHALKEERGQMWILRVMGQYSSQASFAQLWQAVQQVTQQTWRLRALTTLAPYVPESHFKQFFQLAQDVSELSARLALLETLAGRVPEDDFAQFWELVNAIGSERERILLMKALAVRVPSDAFGSFWEAVEKVYAQYPLPELLEALVEHVPEAYLLRFWEVLEELNNASYQIGIKLQLMLLPRMGHLFFEKVLAVRVDELTPELIEGLPQDFLEPILRSVSLRWRLKVLDTLLPDNQQGEALAAHFNALPLHKKDSNWWALVLGLLVPDLREEQRVLFLAHLFSSLHTFSSDHARYTLLLNLATHIPQANIPALFEVIWLLNSAEQQTQVLTAFSRTLPSAGWEIMLHLLSGYIHATGEIDRPLLVLKAAGPALEQAPPGLLYALLTDIFHRIAQDTRRDALLDLLPLSHALRLLGGDLAVREAFDAVLETGYWWP